MYSLALGLAKSFTRITAFLGKDITEVVRRPGTLLSLVLGPFVIMALFGIGYSGKPRLLNTVIALPAGSNLPADPAFYQQFADEAVTILDVTTDVEGAREMLRREQIDLLVIAPSDIQTQFLAGKQATVGIEFNQIDPLRENYARFLGYRQVQELNRVIIEVAAQQGQRYSVQSIGTNTFSELPATVISAPTVAELNNWAQSEPSVETFYAPAVLALVIQHMCVTLSALSMVRERLSGAMDLFRVAPLRTIELLLGKYLAYSFLSLSLGAVVTFSLIGLPPIPLLGTAAVPTIGIPFLGNLAEFALVVFLLSFASLGLGLFISVIAGSERQAVQLSMLVLLASVFFSGFVLPLDEFIPAVQGLAYLLPVTHGIRLFQDLMLRGGSYAALPLDIRGHLANVLPGDPCGSVAASLGFDPCGKIPLDLSLAALGVFLFLVTAFALRRSMTHA